MPGAVTDVMVGCGAVVVITRGALVVVGVAVAAGIGEGLAVLELLAPEPVLQAVKSTLATKQEATSLCIRGGFRVRDM